MILRYISNARRSVCNKILEARHSAAHTNSQYNHNKQRPQVCVLPYTALKTHIQPVLENISVISKLATTIFLLLTGHCNSLEPARKETGGHR